MEACMQKCSMKVFRNNLVISIINKKNVLGDHCPILLIKNIPAFAYPIMPPAATVAA